MCSPVNLSGCVEDAIGSAVDHLAEATADASEWAITTLTTAWLDSPEPDVSSSGSVVTWLNERLSWFVLAVMVVSILVAAYRLATTQRFEHMRELTESLVRVVLVSVGLAWLLAVAIEAADLFVDWILDEADLDLSQMVAIGRLEYAIAVIVLGFIVLIAQIIQLGLMLIRNGMIILLAGILPLAAAASNTQMGRQWFQKASAWLIAFVLYKPAAAIIYAASFQMMSAGQDITTNVAGVFMILLAIFALPALLRFLVPATSAMASGSAGAAAGMMVGAAAATGAVAATGGGGAAASGGGFSGGGTSAASGASGSSPPSGSDGATGNSGDSGGHGATDPSGNSNGGGSGNAARSGMEAGRAASDAASGSVGEEDES